MPSDKKIIGITGIRSDYDILSSVFQAIQEKPGLELELLVMGAHLSSEHGYTVQHIENDGFKIADKIESLLSSDAPGARGKGLGIQLMGMIQALERLQPDLLLVLGDREESISTAIAGSYLNIPIAHIAGGDRVVGNVDDQIRHAVTKLSHLHFPTNEESKERILKMGEQDFRVFNVGNPGLDRILSTPELSLQELSSRLEFKLRDGEPFLILLQHPLSSEYLEAAKQMATTLEALKTLKLKTILIHPNSDAGAREISELIESYSKEPWVHVSRHLPRLEFINLLRKAACLVGNSSLGILEAPLLKLPVVNVGKRQEGRLRSSNVQMVSHQPKDIIAAIEKAVYDEGYIAEVQNCENPYGDGHSSERIADILTNLELNEAFRVKDITY